MLLHNIIMFLPSRSSLVSYTHYDYLILRFYQHTNENVLRQKSGWGLGMRLHYDMHAKCHLVSYLDHPREIRSGDKSRCLHIG